ncbi:hypothetical protein AB3N59_02165 [Leptospira sp. WS92.C1]
MFSQTRANFLHTIRENSKIISYGNKITTLILIGLICFANCQKGKGEQNGFLLASLLALGATQPGFQLSTQLQDSNSGILSNASSLSTLTGMTGGTVIPVSNENVQGLYLYSLTATAYDYRPGEQEQESDPTFQINAPDWSYWMIAPTPAYFDYGDEFQKTINNVLEVGGQVRPDWYRSNGISGNRNFEIDAFNITLDLPGLVYNNEYFGTLWGPESTGINGKHPLYKYPQWSEVSTHSTQLSFPGFHQFQDVPGQTFITDSSITVLFIRNDVLTAPAQIQLTEESYAHPGNYLSVGYSSRTLTATENDFVLSMLRQTYPLMYHTNIVLIPFEGPITIAFDGETNEAEKRFLWNEADVQIGLDVSNILDTDPLKSNLNNLQFTMKGDSNNVPFGINMKVVKKESDGVSKLLTKR